MANLPFKLKLSPVTDALTMNPVALPPVTAPSLEGLKVTVPKPAAITEEELLARLHGLARELGTSRPREVGEPVALGDDVKLDMLGYANRKLIPFSVRFDFWMALEPLDELPDFSELLAGARVGDSVQFEMVLPATYPVASLREQKARFIVDLREAVTFTPLPIDDGPFLAKVNRGATLEALMESLRKELEVKLAEGLVVEAENKVLDALVARTTVKVPKELVDEELKRHWAQVEGKALVERKFTVDEQNEALAAWLNDPPTRADAERRLKISLVLKAIGEKNKLSLTPEKAEEILTASAKAFGFTRQQVHDGLRETTEQTTRMMHLAYHLMMVEFVVSKAEIVFEGINLSKS